LNFHLTEDKKFTPLFVHMGKDESWRNNWIIIGSQYWRNLAIVLLSQVIYIYEKR
jgi:hypothetical protein